MNRDNITVDFFDKIFTSHEQIPDSAKQRLPNDMLAVLFQPKAVFFSQLKDAQSITYQALVEHCGPLMLAEDVIAGYSLFKLVMQGRDCLILGNVFNKTSLEYRDRKDLNTLPNELLGYYQFTDGLNNPLNLAPAVASLDLPGRLSSWQHLDQYRAEHRLPTRRLNKLKKAFGHTFFSIWIRSREDDLILLDFGRRDKKLYHIKGIDFDNWYELKNPVNTIDRYCAHKITGNSGEFDFRNEC